LLLGVQRLADVTVTELSWPRVENRRLAQNGAMSVGDPPLNSPTGKRAGI